MAALEAFVGHPVALQRSVSPLLVTVVSGKTKRNGDEGMGSFRTVHANPNKNNNGRRHRRQLNQLTRQ